MSQAIAEPPVSPSAGYDDFPVLMRVPALPADVVGESISTATQEEAPVAAAKTDVPATAEPAPMATSEVASTNEVELASATTTAAAMAQAREARKQRQQRSHATVTPSENNRWMRSHLPVILAGFAIALLITIYAARSRRPAADKTDDALANIETPGLVIETGSSTDATSATSVAAGHLAETHHDHDHVASAPPKITDTKLPPLLEVENHATTSEKPVADSVAEKQPDAPDADVATTAEYPRTSQPDSYRPLPSTDRPTTEVPVASYPDTNFPSFRR